MSHPSQSSSSFQSLFDAALQDYENKTSLRRRLVDHPLAKKLQNCHSVDSISAVLQGQASSFDQYRDDGRVMKSVKRSVHVLYTLSRSTLLRGAIGTFVPAAKVVFAGIGILLGAVKDVTASYNALLHLFETLENFLRRLEIYTRVPPNDAAALGDIIVKIMVELLSILALATKQVKQGPFKNFFDKLGGGNEIEAALQNLDRLTRDEGQTTAAQTYEMVYRLEKTNRVMLDDLLRRPSSDNRKFVREMTKSERNKLRQDIHKWLSPPDPWKNHKTACESKRVGTSTWWIQGDTYAKWKSSGPSSRLWIHGKPGAGKTVLCSAIIVDILEMCKHEQASLAFFYCDFREDQKKDLRNLVSSLVIQLCDQSDSYHDIISEFFEVHRCGEEYANETELIQCLKDMVNIQGQATLYIIIDALDECPEIAGLPSARDKVLKLVEDLVKLQVTNLRICVTSRPEADIKLTLERLSFCSVSLHSEEGQIRDIAEYIKAIIHTEGPFQKWKAMDRELVIDVITKRADGMFRWVFCQIVYLRDCIPACIRHALDVLPKTLDETYARTLMELDEHRWQYAHRLLQCVAVASRPLRVEELAEFLAFDFDTGSAPTFVVDWQPEDPAHMVLFTCSTLLSIVDVDGSQAIEFSHFSVKEYLTSSRLAESKDLISRFHLSITPSHTIIAQACLSLLLHLGEDVTKDSLEKFPLADYAAEYWDGHARFEGVAAEIQTETRRLFDTRKHHMSTWVWIYDPLNGRRKHSERPSQAQAKAALHYAACCGLLDMVKFLIVDSFEDVNMCDSVGNTPLRIACHNGHLEVALVLLEHAADPNAKDGDNWTALHFASVKGHVDIARVLLEHAADPNAKDKDNWTVLHLASANGHVDLARVLLGHATDLNAKGKNNCTALHFASANGHVDIACLLLEYAADPNAKHKDNWTALHFASQAGHVDIARVLLEHAADPNAKDKDHVTALHSASKNGHVDIARVLLEHTADPNAKHKDDWTALHFASAKGHVDIVHVLLKHAADPNAKNKNNRTALHFASKNGHVDIARVLLEHAADPNAKDKHNRTALHFASKNGHVDIARALLEHAADPNAKNKNNWTALHAASKNGHVDIARALLEHAADPNAKDKHNRTALHAASRWGYLDVLKLLLQYTLDNGTPVNALSSGS